MADTSADTPASASTPSSTAPGTSAQHDAAGAKASKDKACPFCQQPFTSSSLGRHLDLYIKPKNPKPADGVHDMDKIRAMRGGITRRQPRTSLKLTHESEAGSDRGTPMSIAGSERWKRESVAGGTEAASNNIRSTPVVPRDGGISSPVNIRHDDRMRTVFNRTNWQATGVINDIPTQSALPFTDPSAGQTLRSWQSQASVGGRPGPIPGEMDAWAKTAEEREIGKAAELALREVLGSFEAARVRAAQTSLFDFDFYSMNFPTLCLHILPPPSTLFSITPFGSSDSWSLEPPSLTQYEALQRHLGSRVQLQRSAISDQEVQKLHMHMQDAWNHWCKLQAKEQMATWQLDVIRAFARAAKQAQEKDAELHLARQDIEHLRQQYDYLSKCQLPRESMLHPPNTMPISAEVAHQLGMRDAQSRAWDYDRLIGRWRGTVREVSTRGAAHVAAERPTEPQSGITRPPSGSRTLQTSQHRPSSAFEAQARSSWGAANGMPLAPDRSAQALLNMHARHDDEEDADADDDADADADGEDAGMLPHAQQPFQAQPAWAQGQPHGQTAATGSEGGARPDSGAVLNENGKRNGPPLRPFQRAAKGYKVYHESMQV